ncbi:MAG: hypothetical protein Q8L48_42000 [Archangium sp.]|nr:hypothetical protein [Archangium sp.]
MTIKKPGDETIKVGQGFDARSEDSFVGGKSKVSLADLKKAAEAAPEVSQGAWRERVFTPRAVMSRDEVKGGLQSALRVALASVNQPRVAMEKLRPAWLPLMRQALEQAGGDGIDVWLLSLFSPPGRNPKQPLFVELSESLLRMRDAKDLSSFEENALKTVELVDAALANAPVKLSFKQTERHLEGKLEVDELLGVRAGAEEDLNRRLTEIGNTMGQLRDQIRKMPGKQPDGMYANFVRLKAELRVLDAELKRRAGTL